MEEVCHSSRTSMMMMMMQVKDLFDNDDGYYSEQMV